MIEKDVVIQNHITKIENWVINGGPEEHEWDDFNQWIDSLFYDKEKFEFTDSEIKAIQNAFGDSINIDTLQGHVLTKPYGYAGDFHIIDNLYQLKVNSDITIMKWDLFCQNNSGAKAVRNRKTYFINLILSKMNSNSEINSVLDIACGPCRDIKEFFNINPNSEIKFDCIEQDAKAIDYAKSILDGECKKVNFIQKNAIKFTTDKRYDLIWSGGLFDYFTDSIFVRLLKRYFNFLNDNGEMVIGNFSPNNPSKNYMALLEWHLNYRDENKLLELAKECGFDMNYVSIGKEPENVNLFLHVKKH